MKYHSTRDTDKKAFGFEDVLLSGMAHDGGLFIPQRYPDLSGALKNDGGDYAALAFNIVRPFVGDAITDTVLKEMLLQTYSDTKIFEHQDVAPLRKIADDFYLLELFYGPTLSFKDYALQLLGRLFDHVLEKRGTRVTIVGATSGDTGSAAIEACRHCKNIDIFILHPHERTSPVQRRQMTTVDAPNVHNIALKGTFDDCQNMVKAMFADERFRQTHNLSAINSINWARIMAQIVYYFQAFHLLKKQRDIAQISFTVPTGNFGNIFAGWSAKQMGLPIHTLGIATNRNDILTRFFESGAMRQDGVEPSLSPSMDIQISSNFERYLYHLCGRDAKILRGYMDAFKSGGHFKVSPEQWKTAQSEFKAVRCDDETTLRTMRKIYEDTGVLIDPHTAVAVHGAQVIVQGEAQIKTPMVALACAHPAKFADAAIKAIGKAPEMPARLASVMDKKEIFEVMDNDYARVTDYISKAVSSG